jgi:biotin carboxylase
MERARRLLILCTTTGYQTRAFADAARELGLEVVFGSDRCHVLEDPWRDGALALRFEQPEESAHEIAEYAGAHRIDAVVALGDRPTPTAARACLALGLPGHPPRAADAARDKYQSRARLRKAGLNVPSFAAWPLDADPVAIARSTFFPCVVKPLALSGSRGVIRADNPSEFVGAWDRVRALLRTPDVQVMRESTSGFIQVENYIEGVEIAVEALVDRGRLQVLAVFDKPDPLSGPFFEETIYVTPSRLPAETQGSVVADLGRVVRTLGLCHGPAHAEFRINADGVWVLEVAGRPIGGLCARALRFSHPPSSDLISLEQLLIRLALGEDVGGFEREPAASGVMMIPIPAEGIYEGVDGTEEAATLAGVDEIRITAKPCQNLVPLPEGSSYLGFIFARAARPEEAERILRDAHARLHFRISPVLPVV